MGEVFSMWDFHTRGPFRISQPNYYDTLVPLCIKILSKKLFILNKTVLGLLTWDLVPRWTTTFYLDFVIIITVRPMMTHL